ncbi:hypothetical protein CIW50_28335 [Tardiphaga sp. P9-11]|nr:hypothetical protein CIW50_28335 [Tardiphaga sp. P9-11]
MAGMKADRSFQSITMATEASSEAIAYTACDTVAPPRPRHLGGFGDGLSHGFRGRTVGSEYQHRNGRDKEVSRKGRQNKALHSSPLILTLCAIPSRGS